MKKQLGLLLCVALCVGACGGGNDRDEAAAPSETSTTTTIAPTTSSTFPFESDEPPVLKNTGEDFEAILNSLLGYLNWIDAHPSVEAINAVAEPGSPVGESIKKSVEKLVAEAQHNEPAGPDKVAALRVLRRTSESAVLLYAEVDSLGWRVVDADGQLIRTEPGGGTQPRSIELHADASGQWRLYSIEQIYA